MKIVSNSPDEPLKVLRRIQYARDRAAAGRGLSDEHGNAVRLLNIYMGAGFGGVFGSGVAYALQEADINRLACGYAGISSGVMTSVISAIGHAEDLVPFYAGLLSEKELAEHVDKPRRRKRRGKIDLKAHVIDEVEKLVGHDAIHAVPAGLYAVVTEWPTGKGKLIDLKNRHNPYTWLDVAHASMAIPGRFPRVRLGDTEYVDGAASLPIPLIQAIRAVKPTDVFIVASRPMPDEIWWGEHAFFAWYTSVYLRVFESSTAIRHGMERIDERTKRALNKMNLFSKTGINCLALFPSPMETLFPFPIPGLNVMNPFLIEQVGANAKSIMENLLKEARA